MAKIFYRRTGTVVRLKGILYSSEWDCRGWKGIPIAISINTYRIRKVDFNFTYPETILNASLETGS